MADEKRVHIPGIEAFRRSASTKKLLGTLRCMWPRLPSGASHLLRAGGSAVRQALLKGNRAIYLRLKVEPSADFPNVCGREGRSCDKPVQATAA